jgi:hypothetical protein
VANKMLLFGLPNYNIFLHTQRSDFILFWVKIHHFAKRKKSQANGQGKILKFVQKTISTFEEKIK